jgi:hypothetical protein
LDFLIFIHEEARKERKNKREVVEEEEKEKNVHVE